MDWQPIETAPRDGTPILIWQPDGKRNMLTVNEQGDRVEYDDNRYAIGYWRVWQKVSKWMWGNRNCSHVSPTHWMPLPKPPEISK